MRRARWRRRVRGRACGGCGGGSVSRQYPSRVSQRDERCRHCLRHLSVTECPESVHPRGHPMSHSTHVGFSEPPVAVRDPVTAAASSVSLVSQSVRRRPAQWLSSARGAIQLHLPHPAARVSAHDLLGPRSLCRVPSRRRGPRLRGRCATGYRRPYRWPRVPSRGRPHHSPRPLRASPRPQVRLSAASRPAEFAAAPPLLGHAFSRRSLAEASIHSRLRRCGAPTSSAPSTHHSASNPASAKSPRTVPKYPL